MPLALSLLLSGLSVIIGIASTILYVLITLRIDRYEREPIVLLILSFLWGALPAIAMSLSTELAISRTYIAPLGSGYQHLSTVLAAPIIEELVKALALLAIFALTPHEFDGLLDGIVYGAVIGFGFGMSENIAYFWTAQRIGPSSHWLQVVLGRTIAFGFNHAMFTSFTGIAFGLARYQHARRQRRFTIMTGAILAIVVHALHNFFSSSGLCLIGFLLDWTGVAFVCLTAILAWQQERDWLREYLGQEVAEGWLSEHEYKDVLDRHAGILRIALLLPGQQRSQRHQNAQLARAAAELAFKKHQHQVMEREVHSAAIASLRKQIQTIRRDLADATRQDCGIERENEG